jgi:hypothetical protein
MTNNQQEQIIMIRYLNTILYGQRETIDQLDSKDYANYRAFKDGMHYLIKEYVLAGGHGYMYWSQKKCKA